MKQRLAAQEGEEPLVAHVQHGEGPGGVLQTLRHAVLAQQERTGDGGHELRIPQLHHLKAQIIRSNM